MSKKKPSPAAALLGPKVLVLTPQLLLGLAPDGSLFVELPNGSATRKRVALAPGEVEQQLLRILQEKAGEIALDKLLAEEDQALAKGRSRRQPNWRLIARHPEVEIREKLGARVTQVPQRGSQLSTIRCRKNLDEMGL